MFSENALFLMNLFTQRDKDLNMGVSKKKKKRFLEKEGKHNNKKTTIHILFCYSNFK